jgi:hypothetical protein
LVFLVGKVNVETLDGFEIFLYLAKSNNENIITMKKNLLTVLFAFLGLGVFAQTSNNVVVTVLPPSAFAGNLDHSFAVAASGWGVGDLEDPANAVIDTLAVVRDDTPTADSAGCNALINPEEINGKIAVVYRGDCEFGVKALNAQNAGAVAVVIVSRLGEEIITLGGGVNGPDVTIPTVFVLGDAVLPLRDEIDAGTMTMFIGNKTGFYENDLGISQGLIQKAEYSALPYWLNNNDYMVMPRGGVVNYGTETQTNVSLTATISHNGNEVYNETSDAILAMASGDTVFVDLPAYTVPTGENNKGEYTLNYTINNNTEDDFESDNQVQVGFFMSDSLLSYGAADAATSQPQPAQYFRPSTANQSVLSCIHFQNPNVSSLEGGTQAVGMTFAAAYAQDAGDDITGVVVDFYAYEWTSEFTDLDDPNLDLSEETLDELTFGTYEFLANDQEVNIYVPFEDGPAELENDKRYLFCLNYTDINVFTGFDRASTDYTQNASLYNQPLWPLQVDGGDFTVQSHFGLDVTPAYGVRMFSPSSISDNPTQVKVQAYPNPTRDFVNILVPEGSDDILVTAYDLSGKQVMVTNVQPAGSLVQLSTEKLEKGAYIFNLSFSNGSYANFNLMVIE